jgi:hypothetical protein
MNIFTEFVMAGASAVARLPKPVLRGALIQQVRRSTIAQSFSPNSARDGRQVCRPDVNFSVTKMQEEDSIIQSPCFFELADKLVAHLMTN